MTLTITDAFDLPRAQDIRAMGFVIKLREAAVGSDEVRQLVDDYVVTPAVQKELPRILADMQQVYARGEEYGRFIHGSFGSGKSHFMTLLSLLLENAQPAWDKFRPVLADADSHQSWLSDARLLVVRLHMLSVRGRTTGLDRAVYDAFNSALQSRKKEPFEFLNVDEIFAEVRREAEAYGDIVWKGLETAGIVGGRDDFEELAKGKPASRERLARAWLKYKGRDPAQAGIDPRWSEGLKRMGEHARAQGFGGIVLMIDEFLLWLAEKTGQEFVREINDLNVIVDHTTGQRPAPIFVFVARQRNLQEFFPDLVDESKIHEHLDHHAKRFEITKLQDVELRHIVRGRVLRAKLPAEVERAVSGLAERHRRVLPALLANADIEYLRDVYPFHPALIEMLVDVTSLMQRERSALRLLYELLVVHYPNLPLGEFLPVGSAFSALFPESGVEASKKVELMQDIHHQFYVRLEPAMQRMRQDPNTDFEDERNLALTQIVKTVLLAEVSPRLKQGGLTVERLVQLNSADVEGETFRGRVRVAETDLLALSQLVPDLQIAGQGRTALVCYVMGRVSLGEILLRARSKVDNVAQRFKVFWSALKTLLDLNKIKGFEEGGANEGEWDLTWRRTRRRGQLKLGNVREMSYDDFQPPGDTFKVLIDYPWDEPGHTVDEDRMRINNVRKHKGTVYTVCWLPRHMSPTELNVLTELSAVRYLLSEYGQEDLLSTLGPQDKNKALEQASIRANTLGSQLDELLKNVYVDHGEFVALISDVDSKRPRETLAQNLEHITTVLMDRRFPQHPAFLVEPRKKELETLLKWMVEAGEANVSVTYDEEVGKVLRNLGQPLELVNLGQTKASLRMDSRYIKDVLQRTDEATVAWNPIAEHLRETYGLQPMVMDLFLCFLCQRDHRALQEPGGEAIEARIGMSTTTRLRLQRGMLLAAADWHRLRDLGPQLFRGLVKPPAHRTLLGQDSYAAELIVQGIAHRTVLQGLHARIHQLLGNANDKGARSQEISEATRRLIPIAARTTDSHKALTELLDAWPDAPSDPLRSLVHDAENVLTALSKLNESALSNLRAGTSHATLGAEVASHLGNLESMLTSSHAEKPLTSGWIQGWNTSAQDLIRSMISGPVINPPIIGPPRPTVPDVTPPPPPPPPRIMLERRLDTSNGDDISAYLAAVREALNQLGGCTIRVVLSREEDA